MEMEGYKLNLPVIGGSVFMMSKMVEDAVDLRKEVIEDLG